MLTLLISFAALFAQYDIPEHPGLLKAVCLFESGGNPRAKHRNRNGSWDVGLCQAHRPKSKHPPKIPTPREAVKEARRELLGWYRVHQRYCVKGPCRVWKAGKWRGVKNCKRPHYWWGHYNWGYRVLRNGYDKRLLLFQRSGYHRNKRTNK